MNQDENKMKENIDNKKEKKIDDEEWDDRWMLDEEVANTNTKDTASTAIRL